MVVLAVETRVYILVKKEKIMNDIVRDNRFEGSVPINIEFRVIERNKIVDQANNATMDIRAQFTTDTVIPDHPVFFTDNTFSLDDSVIEDAAKRTYPRTATELLPKIIPDMVVEQEKNVSELAETRSQKVRERIALRSRVTAGVGMFTGAAVVVGVTEFTQENYAGGIISTFFAFMGGLVLSAATSRNNPEPADVLKASAELKEEENKLVLLKLIESAVQKNRVQDAKVTLNNQQKIDK